MKKNKTITKKVDEFKDQKNMENIKHAATNNIRGKNLYSYAMYLNGDVGDVKDLVKQGELFLMKSNKRR